MPRYIFLTKAGTILRKTMSRAKATKFGEKSKNIVGFGLASKFVIPKYRIKQLRKK